MDILIYGTINSVTLALYALRICPGLRHQPAAQFCPRRPVCTQRFIAWNAQHPGPTNYPAVWSLVVTGIIGALIYRFF
jgi:hypothetical protein